MDVWSNHACQVAFSPSSALLDLVSVNPRSSPASRNAPLGKRYVNQQAASWSKDVSSKVCPDGLAVTGFWARHALYVPRQGQSPSCWTFMVPEGPRSETSRIQWGRSAERHKKKRQRQATQPGENSQKDKPLQRRLAKDLQITKLGDDQERRP